MKWGESFISQVAILDCKHKDIECLLNYSDYEITMKIYMSNIQRFFENKEHYLFDRFLIPMRLLTKLNNKILKVLFEDMVIVIDYSLFSRIVPRPFNEDCDNNKLNWYSVIYWEKSNVSKYFPSIKWSNYNIKSNSFDLDSYKELSEFILQNLISYPVMLEKSEGKIKATLIKNYIASDPPFINKYDSNVPGILRYSNWSNLYCWCKPTIILANDYDEMKYCLNSGMSKSFKTIKEINIRYLDIDEILEFINTNQTLRIKTYFNPELKIGKNIPYVLNSLYSNHFFSVKISESSMIMIYYSNVIPLAGIIGKLEFKVDLSQVICLDSEDWIWIQKGELKYKDLWVQYDSSQGHIIKQLKENYSELINESKQDLFILIKAKYITQIETWSCTNINVLQKSSKLNLIKFKYFCFAENLEVFISNLCIIPWRIAIEFGANIEYSIIFNNIDFWKVIIKFKKVIFHIKNNITINISGVKGEFNENNLAKNMFNLCPIRKVKLNKRDSITYKDLWELLQK